MTTPLQRLADPFTIEKSFTKKLFLIFDQATEESDHLPLVEIIDPTLHHFFSLECET